MYAAQNGDYVIETYCAVRATRPLERGLAHSLIQPPIHPLLPVCDERGNVVIYSYDPLDPVSRSGRRLIRRADMCLPSRATCSLRVANRLRHALLLSVGGGGKVRPLPTGGTANPVGGGAAELERFRHSLYLGSFFWS